ncbi:hypothetical protein EPUS_02272 [Endocarpon pusillum Z07020]|uniref:Clr5 domain-containing protein n=1 Tax=Endocarpon pusillum (strain Z07020 / HMAS-L-300199) TaxID=1263415 RepID=U1GW80_ENDPU|nr:uncharacterized protein EPUS_02272 [Endocarpon pusillum Z07020]ERF76733.1 hypothetical protein EPUS_02272 [Endocarpon pusillum Z07020]
MASTEAGEERVRSRGGRRPVQVLNWEQHREHILHLYETENRPLREVCDIMRESHGFVATHRMYKTKFKAWGVTKYRVNSWVKRYDRQVKQSHARSGEPYHATNTTGFYAADGETGLPAVHHGYHNGMIVDQDTNCFPILPYRNRKFGHLDLPCSWNRSSSLSSAMSVNHTPNRSQGPSQLSNSEKASILTPESFGSSEANCLPSLAPFEIDSSVARTYDLLGIGSDVEACTPYPRRASQVPRSVPQGCMHDVHLDDQMLAGEIIDQTMGLSSPSTFSIPTPTEAFQELMGRPIEDSVFPLDEFKEQLDTMRSAELDSDLNSPRPETWTTLSLQINVLCGQEKTAEAKYYMLWAGMIFERLVQEKNDQILSILNTALANLFLHKNATLAVELLSQAQVAASFHLEPEDPLIVSMAFMISMAMRKVKTCGINICKLRQVAKQMKTIWGANHRYCIIADYHLAWRLAMEPNLRAEALKILHETQIRSEKVFDPLHMQTVALVSSKARVLCHLGHYLEAQKTSFEALQRVQRWDIMSDHPYYLEAIRRHEIFLKELNRVRSR